MELPNSPVESKICAANEEVEPEGTTVDVDEIGDQYPCESEFSNASNTYMVISGTRTKMIPGVQTTMLKILLIEEDDDDEEEELAVENKALVLINNSPVDECRSSSSFSVFIDANTESALGTGWAVLTSRNCTRDSFAVRNPEICDEFHRAWVPFRGSSANRWKNSSLTLSRLLKGA